MWDHTKLLVFPVVAVGTVEAVLLQDVRRVAWATLVEAIVGALAIVAVFYAYTGALGTGPVLWVDITSFVLGRSRAGSGLATCGSCWPA